MLETRIVLHIDFDYFFAQCEEIRRHELKSKPVCVCVFSDRGGDSGAIATANYNARAFGVKSGMPVKLARKKLEEKTDAVFLPVDFGYYTEISEKAMGIIKENADIFEYVGKDEAFLDVTTRVKESFNIATHFAQQIKNALRDKVKLSCSVGIATNKLVAKIASDYKKPDGLTTVPTERLDEFLENLPIRAIPGIGKKTEEYFKNMKYETIKDLKKLDVFTLNKQFGRKNGTYIFNAIRGIDNEPVKEREDSIQFSKIITLKKDSKDYDFLAENIRELCKEVHKILEKNKKMFKSVGIQFVQSDLSNKSKSKMLKTHTSNFEELQKNAEQLLKEALEDQKNEVRRLGVKVFELADVHGQSEITRYF
jgi:DNA polymerase IV (DinB-like DNA polymerase)